MKIRLRGMNMSEWKEEKGNTVTVYDRYHFAVPVRGTVKETNNDSFKVDFFTNNPGGPNVNKLDGKWFLKGQCKIDEKFEDKPELPPQKNDDIPTLLRNRIKSAKNVFGYGSSEHMEAINDSMDYVLSNMEKEGK